MKVVIWLTIGTMLLVAGGVVTAAWVKGGPQPSEWVEIPAGPAQPSGGAAQ
ncbi:hypothetical protein [Novosphingobium nitrogenifigens]|uniref:hypothetical protein n=1 Tax=Novosphingobium nitrogenifigens TaxID=378548 RepID=UPI0002FA4A7F|nr:hypothetical protein [Novosphingobium nitrogenifigens]